MQLEKTYAVLPSEGKAQLRFFNGMNCDFRITHNIENDIAELSLKALKSAEEKYVPITNDQSTYAFTFTSTEVGCPNNVVLNLALKSNMASSFFITRSADSLSAGFFEDSPEKSSRGFPFIRVVRNFLGELYNLTVEHLCHIFSILQEVKMLRSTTENLPIFRKISSLANKKWFHLEITM